MKKNWQIRQLIHAKTVCGMCSEILCDVRAGRIAERPCPFDLLTFQHVLHLADPRGEGGARLRADDGVGEGGGRSLAARRHHRLHPTDGSKAHPHRRRHILSHCRRFARLPRAATDGGGGTCRRKPDENCKYGTLKPDQPLRPR